MNSPPNSPCSLGFTDSGFYTTAAKAAGAGPHKSISAGVKIGGWSEEQNWNGVFSCTNEQAEKSRMMGVTGAPEKNFHRGDCNDDVL
jgi:hypothetical protein